MFLMIIIYDALVKSPKIGNFSNWHLIIQLVTSSSFMNQKIEVICNPRKNLANRRGRRDFL